jgi:hypothetical protein
MTKHLTEKRFSKLRDFRGYTYSTHHSLRTLKWRTSRRVLLRSFGLWRFLYLYTLFLPNSELANFRVGTSVFHYSGTPLLRASKVWTTQHTKFPKCRTGELLPCSQASKLWASRDLATTYTHIPKCRIFELPESHQQTRTRGGATCRKYRDDTWPNLRVTHVKF